jgi:transcriptional regulator with XRE-family HTH domain
VDQFAFVGETLRRLRKEKGKTLEELGAEAGLGRGQLSRIENGRQEATLGTLSKILTSQGISRREFFRRYDLVESEAQANERASGARAEGAGAPPVESWPQEVREVLGKVESFVQRMSQQTRPVAQGAFEVGDLIVLFRVVPKSAHETTPPHEPEPPPPTGRKGRR